MVVVSGWTVLASCITSPLVGNRNMNKFCMAESLGVSVNAPTVPTTTHAIVVGASAGGITAVRTFLNKLPETIPAAVFVTVHTSPDGPGLLAAVLNRATPLQVVSPDDGMQIRDGQVYVAPPDYHLIVDGRRVRLPHGPREHRFRPAIDPLFRTAAQHFGARTIGVVMSGHMADGTHGMSLIKTPVGDTLVQDPDEAEVPAMPHDALTHVSIDYALPFVEMSRVMIESLINPLNGQMR